MKHKHKHTITAVLLGLAFGAVVGAAATWLYWSMRMNAFETQSVHCSIHNTYSPLADLYGGDRVKAMDFLERGLDDALQRSRELCRDNASGTTTPELITQAEHLLFTLHTEEEAEHPAGP